MSGSRHFPPEFLAQSQTFYRVLRMAAAAPGLVPLLKLGSQGLHVSRQGLGCAAMCGYYGPRKPDDEMISLIRHSVSRGVTFIDTSDIYGPFTSEILLGKALKGIRDKVQLATKFGFDPQMNVHGEPAYVRAACEASLERLDVDCIDLYYQHRVDTSVPIEVTVGEMKKLVAEGKVKYIGLSEASAETVRRAHNVHPITAVQIEWSLWSRDVEEEVIPVCRELGIGIVAYSPLGRGFLSSGAKALENASDYDLRKGLPRFQGENLEKNKVAYENLSRIASKKGCSPSQLALAWLHSQGEDVVPIPGTTQLKNLENNIGALSVNLTSEDIQELESTVLSVVSGESYPERWMHLTWKGSETPPLSSWKA